jgi:hypothetical protein
MGIAQKFKENVMASFKEAKLQRRANVAAKTEAKKIAQAQYRKSYVEESKKVAEKEAKLDVQAGGKFLRKVKEFRKKSISNKSARQTLMGTSQKNPSDNYGEKVRNIFDIGRK